MPYLYLVVSVVFHASMSILGAFFNKKTVGTTDATAFYSLLCVASAFLGWLVLLSTDFQIELKVLPYSVLFAVGYALCNFLLVQALKTGPIALTSLLVQLSLVATTIWGFFFWDTKISFLVVLGLVVVVVSLWLCLYTGKQQGENKITWKWIIYVLLAFLGNATCTIVQRTQQTRFDGQYGNFFMTVSVGLSALICLAIYLKSNKKDSAIIFKKSGFLPIVAGLCNVVCNLCVMLLATSVISPNVVYPVIAVGGLCLTTLCSLFVFKERLKWWQYVGLVLGIISTGILNIS